MTDDEFDEVVDRVCGTDIIRGANRSRVTERAGTTVLIRPIMVIDAMTFLPYVGSVALFEWTGGQNKDRLLTKMSFPKVGDPAEFQRWLMIELLNIDTQ